MEIPVKSVNVSIILTLLNEEKGLAELLDALLGQSRQPDEIVLVDGGSTDGTIGILRCYAEQHACIRLYVEPGANISRGRNIAIRQALHPLIAVTDGGCRPDSNWLRELVRPLEDDEGIGAVGGGFRFNSRNRFEYFSGLLSMPKDLGDERNRLFFGRSSAFRKEVWQAAGGYPEWLYTGEDTLFAVRVRELGWRIGFAPLSIVTWRPRPTLRKLAKMFFLYGRGNGRAGLADMRGVRYHLRNYGLLMTILGAGFLHPIFWLAAVPIIAFIWRIVVLPTLRSVRAHTDDRWREVYVSVIVLTRNVASNFGCLVGNFENRYRHPFRERLLDYRRPTSMRDTIREREELT